MTEQQFEDGSFANVVWRDGWWVGYQTDPRRADTKIVVVAPDGRRIPFPLGTAGAAFPRLHVWANQVYVAFRTGTIAIVRCLDDDWFSSLGPSGGNDPVAFGGEFVVWNDANINRMLRRSIRGTAIEDAGKAVGTGISFVTNDGRPYLVDDVRFAFPGHTLPQWAGPYVVGELPNNNGITIQREEGATKYRRILWPGLPVFVPRIALSPDGTIAVASAGAGHVRLLTLQDSDLSVSQPDVPVPPPPPVTPPPQPSPVTPMQLESKHSHLIEEFAERFGLPGFSKEEGQEWVFRLASTFKARFPGEGWGTKRASHSRPLSNESIARHGNGRLWGYDLIIGAGAPGQHLSSHAHAEDITDQVFIEVESWDWLAGSTPPSNPPPTGPPTPPPVIPLPPTTSDLASVIQRLDALLARPTVDNAELVASVNSLRTFVQNDLMGRFLVIEDKLNQILARPTPDGRGCRLRF